MAGSGVYWDDAAAELAAFAESAGVPVFMNGAGRGCLPADHRLAFAQARGFALGQADVVLVLGTPLDFRLGYGRPPTFAEDARVCMVDCDPAELGRNRPLAVGIAGHIGRVLGQLGAALPAGRERALRGLAAPARRHRSARRASGSRRSARPTTSRSRTTAGPRRSRATSRPTRSSSATAATWSAAPRRSCACSARGSGSTPARSAASASGRRSRSPPSSSIAARRVLLIAGDGAFGLNGMEMETAVRFGLPLTCIIGNDGGWGQIRNPQLSFFGEERAVGDVAADVALRPDGRGARRARGARARAERHRAGARARARLRRRVVHQCRARSGGVSADRASLDGDLISSTRGRR